MHPFLFCFVSLYLLFICNRAQVIIVDPVLGAGAGPGRREAAVVWVLARRAGTTGDLYVGFRRGGLLEPARRIGVLYGLLFRINGFAAPAVFSVCPSRRESFPRSVILRYYRFKCFPILKFQASLYRLPIYLLYENE